MNDFACCANIRAFEMNLRSLCVKFILVVSLACLTPGLRAQDGLEGSLSRASVAQPFRTGLGRLFSQTLAVADFDNDHKPDGAVLLNSVPFHSRNSFRIEVHLSASNNAELAFESSESALSITAWDINKDGATDVILEQPLTHRRLYVWLGDGRGGFHKGRIEDFPSAPASTGQEATAPILRTDYPILSFPPQRGFESTLLKTSHISGRPPSTEQFETAPLNASRSSRVIAHLSSRAPPLSPSL